MSAIDDLLGAVADPTSPLFDALDAHRARQADLARVLASKQWHYSPAYEFAFDEAVHAEAVARKVLADALGLPAEVEPARLAVVQTAPLDWSIGREAA